MQNITPMIALAADGSMSPILPTYLSLLGFGSLLAYATLLVFLFHVTESRFRAILSGVPAGDRAKAVFANRRVFLMPAICAVALEFGVIMASTRVLPTMGMVYRGIGVNAPWLLDSMITATSCLRQAPVITWMVFVGTSATILGWILSGRTALYQRE